MSFRPGGAHARMHPLVTPMATNEVICWNFHQRQEQLSNSSGDEIANENFFTTASYAYFKVQKREPTSCSKLNDS